MEDEKIKVHLTLTWDISYSEWLEGKEHWIKIMEEKIIYNPIHMFWMLNNIRWPELTNLKIEKIG